MIQYALIGFIRGKIGFRLYVTSSSYTKPVKQYAAEMRRYPGIDSLELKELGLIVEWAKEHKTRMLLDFY